MSNDVNRTFHASQALELGLIVAQKFVNRRYGTDPKRVVKVSELDGPSTDGGRKARQSLVLAASDGYGPAIVFGWIDTATKRAELRSWSLLNKQFQARAGRSLDVDIDSYGQLLDEMDALLRSQGVYVTHATEASMPIPGGSSEVAAVASVGAQGAAHRAGRGKLAMGVVLGALVGFGVAFLAFWLMFRG